ncbi:MAG TPA: DUF2314 domain-containing protein [Phycisphaerae bacterium]|nr:DUF2314 domain-containing protein [Phycisphaerae bacterium]
MKRFQLQRPLTLRSRAMLAAAICPAVMIATIASLDARQPADQTKEQSQVDDDERLISLVLLLSEPRKVDEEKLMDAVNRAGCMPRGGGKDKAGFCVPKPPYCMMMLDCGRVVVTNIAEPYFSEPEKLAAGVRDEKLAEVIRKHRAWISIDWGEEEDEKSDVKNIYQHIGKIAVALAGPETLAIYNPDTDGLVAYDDALAKSLKGDDPLERFVSAPAIIVIDDADSQLKAARSEAKQKWPEFVTAFREKRGEQFAVKGRIVEGDNVEYLWLNVTSIDDSHVHGTLANAPVDLEGFKLGQEVHIIIDDVGDWIYIGPDKEPKGAFTHRVLEVTSKP